MRYPMRTMLAAIVLPLALSTCVREGLDLGKDYFIRRPDICPAKSSRLIEP